MMNMMSLLLVAVVAFTYFGGQNVPKVLKDNKQMVLGVFVGVLLHQFMGIGVEGGNFGEETESQEQRAARIAACEDGGDAECLESNKMCVAATGDALSQGKYTCKCFDGATEVQGKCMNFNRGGDGLGDIQKNAAQNRVDAEETASAASDGHE
jgi:hypothetical protein